MHAQSEDLFAQKISSADFKRIRSLIYEHTAIVVPEDKKDFVRSRILKRMRHINVSTLSHYCDLVESGREPLSDFTSQVTTNHTHFFRERHHFDTLVDHLRETGCANKVIWSSACSSGEEPYSIALTIRENFPDACNGSLKIIASDLDERVLDVARTGVYTEKRVEMLSRSQKALGFMRGRNDMAGTVKTKDWMNEMIEFRKVNLMDTLNLGHKVDVIFCRNVVIYFDQPSKIKLFAKFADLQKTGDLLLIGHSESLNGICNAYRCLGSTVYQRL
jgi:chemotaxis protein methyltransferase CheR